MDASNRTFVSSVLFLDIIEYSKCSVTEQMQLKQRFNALLVSALRNVAVSERIVLDTGDGAAISFLGDPEAALFAAMALRDGVVSESQSLTPTLAVRIGINLGPVRLIKDINGQLNIIGDGINVAQRIMSFSDPGAILVSRSYYEVVSRLSDDYAQIFSDAGVRTDKHVREHAVYAIGSSLGGLSGAVPHASIAGGAIGVDTGANRTDQLFLNRPERRNTENVSAPPRASGVNKGLMGTVAVLSIVIIGMAIWFRSGRSPAPPATEIAAVQPDQKTPEAGVPEKQAAEKEKPMDKAAEKPLPKPVPATPASAVPPAAPAKEPPGPAVVAPAVPGAKPEKTKTEKAEKAEKTEVKDGKATLTFTIQPWGDIYMDGSKRGASPPLKSIKVAPGTHVIMIRNADFPPHIETVEATAGATIAIRHKF